MTGNRSLNFAFSCLTLWLLVDTLRGLIPFLWIGAGKPLAGPTEAEEGFFINTCRIIFSIGVNLVLLFLFVLQHSGFASLRFKSYLSSIGFEILHRSIYISTTAIALKIIMRYWQWMPEISFWQLHVEQGTVKWWAFFAIHFLAWTIMYGGSIMMDLAEMVGLKQVYYHSCDLDSPIQLKSYELQILFQHMRHPSFSLCVILWCHPHMTLGRIMFALVFPIYMIMRFPVDMKDYYYQKRQFEAKLQKLKAR